MSEITDAEIQEVLEYCEKAAEGPWFWKQSYQLGGSEHWELTNPESDAAGKTIDASLILEHDSPTWFAQPCAELPNWVFIARARTDLPRFARALQEARQTTKATLIQKIRDIASICGTMGTSDDWLIRADTLRELAVDLERTEL